MVRVRIKSNKFFISKENRVFFNKENWSTCLVGAYKFGFVKYFTEEKSSSGDPLDRIDLDISNISLDSDLSKFPTLVKGLTRAEPELKVNFVCRYRKKNHFFVYRLKNFAEEEELSKWIKYRLEKANREANIKPASNSYLKVFSLKVAKEVIRKVKSKFNSSALELCNDLNLFSLHEYVLVNVSRELIKGYKEYPLIIYLFLTYQSITTYRQPFITHDSQNSLWTSVKIGSHYPFLIKMIHVLSSNLFSDVRAIVEALRFKRISLEEVKEISKETAYYIYKKAKLNQKLDVEVIEELMILGLKMNTKVFISLTEHLYCKASDINNFILQYSRREDSVRDCRLIVCSFLEMCSLADIKEDEIDLTIKVLDFLLEILRALNYQGLIISKLDSNPNKIFILKRLVDLKNNSTKLIGRDNTDILIEMLKGE